MNELSNGNKSVKTTQRCGSIKRTTEMATPNGDMVIVLQELLFKRITSGK